MLLTQGLHALARRQEMLSTLNFFLIDRVMINSYFESRAAKGRQEILIKPAKSLLHWLRHIYYILCSYIGMYVCLFVCVFRYNGQTKRNKNFMVCIWPTRDGF